MTDTTIPSTDTVAEAMDVLRTLVNGELVSLTAANAQQAQELSAAQAEIAALQSQLAAAASTRDAALADASAKAAIIAQLQATVSAQALSIAQLGGQVTAQAAVIDEQNTEIASLEAQLAAGGTSAPTPTPDPIPAGRVAEFALAPRHLAAQGGSAVPQVWADYIAAGFSSPTENPPMSTAGTLCMTIKSGRWSDPATWMGGTIPGDNCRAMIMGGHSVTYDVHSTAKIIDVMTMGTGSLTWDTTIDTLLWVDTLMPMGSIRVGTYQQPIPESATPGQPRAEVVWWQSQDPGVTSRLGWMSMGQVRINGAAKTDRLWFNGNAVGDTVLHVDGLAGSNWRVGDTVVKGSTSDYTADLTDPTYKGPSTFYGPCDGWPSDYAAAQQHNDPNTYGSNSTPPGLGFAHDFTEERVITAIDMAAATVTVDRAFATETDVVTDTLPQGQTVTVKPVIANLSRSIRFRSAEPGDATAASRAKRGHMMFMYDDDVQARWFECVDMGRTDTDPTLWQPDGRKLYTDSTKSTSLSDPNNVRGRYAGPHLHFTKGPTFGAQQQVIQGVVVRGTVVPYPGWGIVQHAARAAIENCICYNGRGAGFVTEIGSEQGQWIDNTAIAIRGDGFNDFFYSRAENCKNHNGHQGVGFENQSRSILQRGNISICCHIHMMYHAQSAPFIPVGAFGEPSTYNGQPLSDTNMPDTIPYTHDEYSLRPEMRHPLQMGATSTPGGGLASNVVEQTLVQGNNAGTYGANEDQIPPQYDCYAYSCGSGLHVLHRRMFWRGDDITGLFRRMHCVGVDNPFAIEQYSHRYYNYDFLWARTNRASAAPNPQKPTIGADIGNVAWQFMNVNGKPKNYQIGVASSLNYDGFPIDIDTSECDTAIQYGPAFQPDAPNKGLMGPETNGQERPPIIYRSSDFPLPYPTTATGGYGGVEPASMAGTPKPYLYLEPRSTTTLDANGGYGQVVLGGCVVDGCGVRKLADWCDDESEGHNAVPSHDIGELAGFWGGQYILPDRIVKRNGCFTPDGGTTWKSRLWFPLADRLTGARFNAHVDITLVNFLPDFLATYTVDPAATEPPLESDPEALRTADIVARTAAPAIVSNAGLAIAAGEGTINAYDTQLLAVWLQSTNGMTTWSLGGPDARKFEVVTVGGKATLRWLGNIPADITKTSAAGSQAYGLDLIATDPAGNATTLPVLLTVREYYEDTFAYTGGLNANKPAMWNVDQGGTTANGDGTVSQSQNGVSMHHMANDGNRGYVEWSWPTSEQSGACMAVGFGGLQFAFVEHASNGSMGITFNTPDGSSTQIKALSSGEVGAGINGNGVDRLRISIEANGDFVLSVKGIERFRHTPADPTAWGPNFGFYPRGDRAHCAADVVIAAL